ncbi:leucine-rich repeat, cysteine-containing subtype protein [Tanacetum coccineum]
MEQVLNYVIPYIHDVNDRKSISLVSYKLFELDCITRKHVIVHFHYALNPSHVRQRFPFIESLTLKGVPHKDFSQVLDINIAQWIVEISVKFKLLKALYIRGMVVSDEDIELLARTRDMMSKISLVSLKIFPRLLISDLGDAFNHAIKLKYFDAATFEENRDYSIFKFPMNISGLCIYDLPATSFMFLLPYVNQLRCANLEVIDTQDICGDTGLQVISLFCKKLRKLTYDFSNKAMECIGTHLKNLCDLRMSLIMEDGMDAPVDNGIGAMLMGCNKLRRLHISLCHGNLTDVGESDTGLLELSKGCPKLRKLKLKGCPFSERAIATFVFNIHSIRCFCVKIGYRILALTRLTVPFEVLTELKPYVTLAEKLHKLAVQLVADGSGVGSVKMTYTSSKAKDDFDTQLVRVIVANDIRINEERVILDRSSKKPLETIKVQIVNVESCFTIAVIESGEIKVEGRDDPNFIGSIINILGEENVNINSMSAGRTAQRKQAVMAIGVDEKPSKEALKKIDEISAVEEFVFLVL